MFSRLYSKGGLYLKNGTNRQRDFGFRGRRFAHFRDYYKRRSLAKKLEEGNSVTIGEDKGYKVLNGLESLRWTSEVIRESQTEFNRLNLDKTDWVNKKHLYSGVLKNYTFDENSVFIKFVLQKDILAAVISYFGYIPVLNYIGVWYSKGGNLDYENSQLFHLDRKRP